MPCLCLVNNLVMLRLEFKCIINIIVNGNLKLMALKFLEQSEVGVESECGLPLRYLITRVETRKGKFLGSGPSYWLLVMSFAVD